MHIRPLFLKEADLLLYLGAANTFALLFDDHSSPSTIAEITWRVRPRRCLGSSRPVIGAAAQQRFWLDGPGVPLSPFERFTILDQTEMTTKATFDCGVVLVDYLQPRC